MEDLRIVLSFEPVNREGNEMDTEKRHKTTLRSIARDLDMSVMTVVRTLNGNPRVSDHTRLKVMQRVKELGFNYKTCSKNARNERMQEVAVYCADEKFYGDRLFNFFMRLYYYCVRELKAHDMKATLLPQDLLDTPDPDALLKYGTLIILGPFLPGKTVLKKWKKLYTELRIVSVLGDPLPVSAVCADDYSGGASGARKLFELGHHHIAVFSSLEEQSLQKRFAGFCGEFFRLDENVVIDRITAPVHADFSMQLSAMRDALDHYFNGREKKDLPTAFFLTNGYFALVLADYLKERGLSIPDDVSILGYDNLEAMAEYDPPIDRIAFDLKSAAVGTVALLCRERISGISQNAQVFIENTFISGKSLIDIKNNDNKYRKGAK